MSARPTLQVVAGWAHQNRNPKFLRAMQRLDHHGYANRGRIMVAKGAFKIAVHDSPAAAIAHLEQQIAEIKAIFPQQPKEQPR
jgi:hypothetical protein